MSKKSMLAYFAGKVIRVDDITGIDIKSGVIGNKKEIVVSTKNETIKAECNEANTRLLVKLIDQYNKSLALNAYLDECD